MNFISHLFLSGNNDGLLIGNFIADSVKGKDYLAYEPPVMKGIILHRKIDYFTDSHPTVRKSKLIYSENFHHFSGIIVDIIYDHFLVSQWRTYNDFEIEVFAKEVLKKLELHEAIFPSESRYFLEHIKKFNRIEGYASLENIKKVLAGMSKRTTFKINLEESLQETEENYESLKNDFNHFFPLLMRFTENEIKNLA